MAAAHETVRSSGSSTWNSEKQWQQHMKPKPARPPPRTPGGSEGEEVQTSIRYRSRSLITQGVLVNGGLGGRWGKGFGGQQGGGVQMTIRCRSRLTCSYLDTQGGPVNGGGAGLRGKVGSTFVGGKLHTARRWQVV